MPRLRAILLNVDRKETEAKPMSDRKNLKISPETYELLREKKGQYQTWDGFFHAEFGDE